MQQAASENSIGQCFILLFYIYVNFFFGFWYIFIENLQFMCVFALYFVNLCNSVVKMMLLLLFTTAIYNTWPSYELHKLKFSQLYYSNFSLTHSFCLPLCLTLLVFSQSLVLTLYPHKTKTHQKVTRESLKYAKN